MEMCAAAGKIPVAGADLSVAEYQGIKTAIPETTGKTAGCRAHRGLLEPGGAVFFSLLLSSRGGKNTLQCVLSFTWAPCKPPEER